MPEARVEETRFGPGWRRALAGIGLLALALRVAAVVAVADSAQRPYTFEHGQIAANLLAGEGFSIRFLGAFGPTSQQAPCYPLLLAGVEGVLGQGFAALATVQILQAVAGAACVVLLTLLVWRWLPEMPAAGILAGLFLAIQPTQIYAVTQIQPAVWIGLVLVGLLLAAARPALVGDWRHDALCGSLAGLLLLWEPILALALPIALVMRLQRGRAVGDSWAGLAKRAAAFAGVALVVIAPWLARNAFVHGEFVFIKSTFGYAFWQGNNPLSHGTDKIPAAEAEAIRRTHDGTLAGRAKALEAARLATRYIDDVALGEADYRQLAAVSEPARCRMLLARATDFIRENPAAYARLCGQRLKYFLLFDETNPRAANATFRIATVAWLVLGFTGFIASLSRWRVLWPSYALFVAIAAFHALTITSVRFRLPIEPLALVWGATALAPLAVHLRLAQQRVSEDEEAATLPEGTHLSLPHAVLRGPHRGAQEPASSTATRRKAS